MALPCVLPPLKRHALTRLASVLTFLLCFLPVWNSANGQAIPVVVPGTLMPASSSANTCTTNKQCGDGGPLSAATFTDPSEMAFDSKGNFYILDRSDDRIRKATKAAGPVSTWTVTSYLGQSQVNCPFTSSACGDGGLASDPSAMLNHAEGMAFSPADDLYIADFDDNRLRRVDHATGILTTYAGNGLPFNSGSIEGLPATQVAMQPFAVAVAPDNTVYVVDGNANGNILAIDPVTQTVHVVPMAPITSPQRLAVAPNGDLYVLGLSTTTVLYKIAKSNGAVTVVAGGGTNTNSEAVRSATDASFRWVADVKLLPSNDLLLVDGLDRKIYRLEMQTGLVYTVAGCNTGPHCNQTNTAASNAAIDFDSPWIITSDTQGDVFYVSQIGLQIFEVANTPGTILFNATAVNTRSTDSPQIAYLMNFGAQPMTLDNGTTGVPSTFNPFLTTLTAGAENSFTLDSTINTANDSVTTPCALPSSNPSPATLAGGATCGFALGYQPTKAGSIGGSLTINYTGSNGDGNQKVIPLNFIDTTTPPPTLTDTVSVSPDTITYSGTSVILRASVFFPLGSPAPAGTATFSVEGSAPIAATCVNNTSFLACTATTYNPSALNVGNHTITFTMTSDSNYAAVSGTSTLTVDVKPVSVTLSNLMATFDGNPHAVTVTTNPTGVSTTVTYNGSSTVPSAAGQYTVVATVSDSNYSGSASDTLTISAATTPTLNFAIPTHTFGDPDFAVSATSNSSGSITYSYVSGPAMLSGNTVHLTGAGSVSIMASQAASGSFAATTKTATFTVNKAAATVMLGNLTATFDGNPHAATAVTNPAGLSVSFTYSGSATPPSAIGSYQVVATINDANYTGSATGQLTISSLPAPTLNFNIPTHTFDDADFSVAATSNSTGAITYTYVSGPAMLSGNTVHITGAGTVTLQAAQAANGTYAAATKSATFVVNKATPTIHWATPAAVPYGTTIGAAQLNAAATGVGNSALTGIFLYTPASGSIAHPSPSETLQVVFIAEDAANYTMATASVMLPVTTSVLDVTANNATRIYGTPNPTFNGTVTGQQNGDTFSETFSTNATQTSNAGAYTITPAAVGPNASSYTQRIHTGMLNITRANVVATASFATQGNQNELLTATIATSTTGTPTGSVTFLDNGVIIGTPQLNGTQATLNTTFNTVGTHTITTTYSDDVNFMPATITQTITINAPAPQDFTLTLLSPPTTSLSVGDSGSYQLRVSPPAGQTFAGDVHLLYSGDLPTYATGEFSADTVKAGSASTDITFKFVTMKLSRAETYRRTGAAIAAAMLLPLCLLRRRKTLRGLALACIALVTLAASTLMTGCGSGYRAGTIPVQIIAQSGSITHVVKVQANILKTNQ